jgi:hypothetical protein
VSCLELVFALPGAVLATVIVALIVGGGWTSERE